MHTLACKTVSCQFDWSHRFLHAPYSSEICGRW